MAPQTLQSTGWVKTVEGRYNAGNQDIGTCTSQNPASTIDYFVHHRGLNQLASQAEVNMGRKTNPTEP